MIMNSKILNYAELVHFVEVRKRDGKQVVMMSGSFDLLHGSHVQALTKARSFGNVLVVLLNGDSSVRLYKGPSRPIQDQHIRSAALAELPIVDAIYIFDELTPVPLLSEIHPNIYCVGEDWGSDCVERSIIQKHEGKLEVIPRGPGSTSEKIASQGSEMEPRKAVILDRDGTLIKDIGYLHNIKDVEFFPHTREALTRIANLGFHLFIATNQSGIGRGMFNEEQMNAVHEYISAQLQEWGIPLAGIYVCPHSPDGDCACRKPKTGMLEHIAIDHGVALGKSWFIGDSCSDVSAGRLANMHTIRIGSGPRCEDIPEEYTVGSLTGAAEVIASLNE